MHCVGRFRRPYGGRIAAQVYTRERARAESASAKMRDRLRERTGQQASMQADKQASTRASEQASKQEGTQTGRRAGRQAGKKASQQAGKQAKQARCARDMPLTTGRADGQPGITTEAMLEDRLCDGALRARLAMGVTKGTER